MRLPFSLTLVVLILSGCASTPPAADHHAARPDTITLATYNVEHFNDHFRGFHMDQQAATRPADAEMKDLTAYIKRINNRIQWEVANVITDPAFSPDILCIEEGPEQGDLEFFNKKWLNSMYQTVIVFKTNTLYHQTVDMLLKPGFKIMERRDQYYLESDPGHNARGDRLFARGPAFLLVQAPSGYTFWIGVTHQKSKSGNSLEVTQWRNREAHRTHEILKDLEHSAHPDVILLGDMNDEIGADEYEKDPSSGGDAMATLVGPSSDGFMLATKPLADKHEFSFHGYYGERFRGLIDHAVLSKEVGPRLQSVQVFHDQWTPVASDHYPVLIRLAINASR